MSDEAKSTKTDPLTNATRATKRNLLAAAIVAITFKAFDISADKIPVAGLAITFNRGVFEFLLVAVLCYFLATFVLYYYIDIRNFPRSAHQTATDQWRSDLVRGFNNALERRLRGAAMEFSLADFRINPAPVRQHLEQWSDGLPGALRYWHRVRRQPLSGRTDVLYQREVNGHLVTFVPDDTNPHYIRTLDAVEKAWCRHTKWLPLRYARFSLPLRPRLWTVGGAYFVRNYCIDGVLPIVMAIVALATLYDLIDVHALARLAPK